VGGHEDPGRAEPALCGAVIAERGLERVRRPGPGPGETLDGRDAPALGLPDRGDAGEDGLVIEEDGAGAAVALVAPLLRAGQAEDVAERLEQGVVHGDADAMTVPVDFEFGDRVHGPPALGRVREGWRAVRWRCRRPDP